MAELQREIVYQHLKYRWSIFGLYTEHLIAAAVPGFITFYAGMFFGFSMLWSLIVFLFSAFAIVVLQWRKPPEHMIEVLTLLISPRHYTHVSDETGKWEFPVSREELE